MDLMRGSHFFPSDVVSEECVSTISVPPVHMYIRALPLDRETSSIDVADTASAPEPGMIYIAL